MITLLFANNKGGVGKTTSLIALAHEFARRGFGTLVVDSTDGSATSLLFPRLLQSALESEGQRRLEIPRPIRMPLPVFSSRCGLIDLICTNERFVSYLRRGDISETELDWGLMEQRYALVLVDTPSGENPFQITGGTGRFADSSGSGTWLVPAPTTFDGVTGVGDEFLLGSLVR